MVKKKYDDLSIRMKEYEQSYRNFFPKRLPVIIRIDGKAFHTYTKGFKKPFDDTLSEAMWETTKFLCENIQGCKIGYTQSDEISLLLTNFEKLTTNSWFDNNIQKMVSVSASLATAKFNEIMKENHSEKPLAFFDARAWVVPQHEVCNYFIWRQQDATKNSIAMLAQSNFSHKSLQGLKGNQMQDKLMLEKNINWNDLPVWQKRGAAISKVDVPKKVILEGKEQQVIRRKWDVDMNTPIFTKDRDYIDRFVFSDKVEE